MEPEKFTLFYSAKSPFSQHHLCNFVIVSDRGTYTFNCCEQVMMSFKAALFNDEETWRKIMEEDNPQKQKRLGREVKNYDDAEWNAYAKDVVYLANYCKFTQNPELKEVLFATAGTTLVEASPIDQKWGIGLSASDPRCLDRSKWLGTNWLGEVLTTLRDDLLNKETDGEAAQ